MVCLFSQRICFLINSVNYKVPAFPEETIPIGWQRSCLILLRLGSGSLTDNVLFSVMPAAYVLKDNLSICLQSLKAGAGQAGIGKLALELLFRHLQYPAQVRLRPVTIEFEVFISTQRCILKPGAGQNALIAAKQPIADFSS